ncbi:MAG: peptide chain release factor N(5)-glutamine methyltransferase [Flavobacteriales bacterium]
MNHTLGSIKAEFLSALQYDFTQREKFQLFNRLMEECWGVSQVTLLTDTNAEFKHSEELLAMVSRLNDGEPVQYITGNAYFRELKLKVTPEVLIPRPETEELVSIALEQAADGSRVLDLGTGSGCIALSLKQENRSLIVSGLDVSEGALSVAKENAKRLKLDLDFHLKSMDEPLEELGEFDILVSNPPYIGLEEETLLEKNVIDYEPRMALFSINSDTLYFYKSLYHRSLEVLKSGGVICLELHEDHADATAELFTDAEFKTVEILLDFQGKKRFLKAEKR